MHKDTPQNPNGVVAGAAFNDQALSAVPQNPLLMPVRHLSLQLEALS
jgi:hypothetical protein